MDNLPTTGDVQSWPQAVVAIVMILALAVWPGVQAFLNAKRTKQAVKTLTQNNGGGSIKDQLDRIEAKVDQHSGRLEALEQPRGILGKHRGK